MTPAISSVVRNFVRDRLLDTANNGFNELILETSDTYGVPSFQLSLTSGGDCSGSGNLYLGRYDLASLVKAGAASSLPLAVLSVAKDDAIARANLQVTPSTYSGSVIVSLDFWLSYPGGIPSDGESRFEAIEDAIIGTFNAPATYSMVSQGIVYNNEIMIEQGRMDYSGSIWIQQISTAIIFRLTT